MRVFAVACTFKRYLSSPRGRVCGRMRYLACQVTGERAVRPTVSGGLSEETTRSFLILRGFVMVSDYVEFTDKFDDFGYLRMA